MWIALVGALSLSAFAAKVGSASPRQEGREFSRVVGRALVGPQDTPLVGATVLLWMELARSDPWGEGPRVWCFATTTGEDGAWGIDIKVMGLISGPGDSRSYDPLLDLNAGRASRLAIEVWDMAAGRAWRQERADVDLSRGLDVGQMRCAPVEDVCYRVLGRDGKPLSGAQLGRDTRLPEAWSLPAGGDGIVCLRGVPQGSLPLLVCAPGWEAARVDPPGDRHQPVDVTLAPAAVLEVRAKPPSGVGLGDLELEVEVEGTVFFSGPRGPESVRLAMCTGRHITRSGPFSTRVFRWSEDVLVLSDLATGVPVRLRLMQRAEPPPGRAGMLPGTQIGKVVELKLERGVRTSVTLP